jgi:chromosome segregation ATPase
MSQLEAQVLALQQEKQALLARVERESDHASPAQDTRSVKRARTADRSHDHADSHQTPTIVSNGQPDYVARLQDRIVELERWTEELDGALSDARDSEARWRNAYAEEHRALKYADAHAARLASDLRALETERLVHLRELADLKDDLDTECGTVRSLRAENLRLTETLEGVEVALDLQRVENDKLRDRLAAMTADELPRGSSMDRRLMEDLEDTQRDLEKSRAENDRLRMALEDMRAPHGGSVRSSASDSVKMQNGASSASASTKYGHSSRTPSPSADSEQYINHLRGKLVHAQSLADSQSARLADTEKEVDDLYRERYMLKEHISTLESRLDKMHSYSSGKGVAVELE